MQSLKSVEVAIEKIQALDEYFKDYFRELENHLNYAVLETSSSDGCWMVPSTDSTPGIPTIATNGENVFSLNEAGTVTTDFEKVPMNMVVIRYTIDYTTALFASKSKKHFTSVFSTLVNDMIEELRVAKGFTEDQTSYGNKYGSFFRPGSDEVFKDRDDATGLEIRLYSDSSRLLGNK